MSDAPLFQNMDEQEAAYTGTSPERIEVDEQGSLGPPRSDAGDTPAAVPLGTGGGIAATPASDAFDPGMDREERDLARGDTNVIGRDPQDMAR